jgi:hypothetical protein
MLFLHSLQLLQSYLTPESALNHFSIPSHRRPHYALSDKRPHDLTGFQARLAVNFGIKWADSEEI